MRNWFMSGFIVFLLFLAATFFVPVPSSTGLPTSSQLLTQQDAFFPPGEHSFVQVIFRLVTLFPPDVIIVMALLFFSGLLVQFLSEGSMSPRTVEIRSPSWVLLGTVVWVFSAFEGGFVLSSLAGGITSSPLVRHWVAGLTVQAILCTAVIILPVLSPSWKQGFSSQSSWGEGFREGVWEYIRAYPLLLLALLINEWLVVQYLSPDLPGSYRLLGAAESVVEIALLFLLVCLVAPVVEEFFFRGILYSGLRGLGSVVPSAVLGGALFSLIHFETQLILPLWVFGTILCLVYEWTGSIKVVITMHFLQNTVSFFMIRRLL
jgi:membrane protease YdiL (CAAX protease family)